MKYIAEKPLREVWLKASVAGSIWASVEIILGSFLHNLRIPFSGMILSFISVFLLTAFVRIWKERGLVIRAGLICALMKSISPSAVILGPMTGIITEALLLELFIVLFGRNLFALLAGGALAVLSTLLHKFVSLIILYGFDFLKILTDLYRFSVKQIGFVHADPYTVIIIISSVYMALGIIAAAIGYATGNKYSAGQTKSSKPGEQEPGFSGESRGIGNIGQYSIVLLLLHISVVTGILLLLNLDLIIPALVSGSFYIIFCTIKYPGSLRKLNKPVFWISFAVIAVSSGYLWNGFAHGARFSSSGLEAGLLMNARSVLIIVGFASISVELRNPLIRSLLYRRGLSSLYQSINLSFSALPFMISSLSGKDGKKDGRLSFTSLGSLLGKSDHLLQSFKDEHQRRPEVMIITGSIGSGKTTAAAKIIEMLHSENIKVGGFLSVGIDSEKNRSGFILRNIATSEETELCSTVENRDRLKTGKYFFNREAFVTGKMILEPERLKGARLIIIDEIGPLELKGLGWSSAIENLCHSMKVPQLWVVRKGILESVLRKWNIGSAYIFEIENDKQEDIGRKVKELLCQ
jgi:nucleoside-triphosphatase THEP1